MEYPPEHAASWRKRYIIKSTITHNLCFMSPHIIHYPSIIHQFQSHLCYCHEQLLQDQWLQQWTQYFGCHFWLRWHTSRYWYFYLYFTHVAEFYFILWILNLCWWLVCAERVTRGLLNEFLGKYGKEVNKEREEKKRLGMTQKESAALIVKDYQLSLTPDQFIQEINPLYIQR